MIIGLSIYCGLMVSYGTIDLCNEFRHWRATCSAPSHYLNQCCCIIDQTLGNKLPWNIYHDTKLFIEETGFENVVCVLLVNMFQPKRFEITTSQLVLSIQLGYFYNENIFRVSVPLCGGFSGHRWIPHTRASDAEEHWCFLLICARINGSVSNREAGDLRRHRGHYDVIVMVNCSIVAFHTAVSREGHEHIRAHWVTEQLMGVMFNSLTPCGDIYHGQHCSR